MDKYNDLVTKLTLNDCNLSEHELEIFSNEQFELILSEDDEFLKQSNEIKVGVFSLCAFIKFNFLSDLTPNEKLTQLLLNLPIEETIKIEKEEIYVKVKAIKLLFISLNYFQVNKTKSLIHLIWYLRCLIIYQLILIENSNIIYEEIVDSVELINGHLENLTDSTTHCSLFIQCALEISQIFLFYRDAHKCQHYLQKALSKGNLEINLTGALGKRTRFQQKATSLLTVDIKRVKESESEFSNQNEYSDQIDLVQLQCPKNIQHNDDTLLERKEFVNETHSSIRLSPIEESLVLNLANYNQKLGPKDDDLIKEETLTYIEFLIANSKIFSIRLKALLLRSLMEQNERRKIERSMMQLNELVDSIKLNEKFNRKFELIFSSGLQPIWITEKYFADCLVSLGCIKSALDVYLRLEHWEECIDCYHKLNRKDKAEAIIREKLNLERTPYLLCLLGDATLNIDHYHEAWKLSNERSWRAMRSLGDHYFYRKEYNECIAFYQKSLEINSLQCNLWQRLAYAALDCEKYELCASAYKRYIQFDTETFEVWNNLAKCYIKLNDKLRAWRSLQEAIKCNYEEWRIWENNVLISIDIGEFDDVILSWQRLIDLKHKFDDDEIAEILVNIVCKKVKFNEEKEATINFKRLNVNLKKLFARITNNQQCSYKFWKLYAKLLLHSNNIYNDCGDNSNVSNKNNENSGNNEADSLDLEKIIKCINKSSQVSLNANANWEKQVTNVLSVLENCLDLFELYKELLVTFKSDKEIILIQRSFHSYKMTVNNIIITIKNNDIYWKNDIENGEKIIQSLNELDDKLSSIKF